MDKNKAMIFDIVRNSFVDGPGIRTTVFFKGCNLKCAWCHNPESQSFEKQMMFYKNKCTNCGKCREVCPYGLTKCDFCGKCELYCPNDARKICGKEMTIDEVFAEIIKDKTFYESSGGGATFSGGECMLQIDFLEKILKKCKENNIHTAVDTAGYVAWNCFERILPYTDLFLYDVKMADMEKHKQYTGVDNKLIIENLAELFHNNAHLWIRIPIISGVNSNEDEILKIKKVLSPYKPDKIELLPYHAMGEHKYTSLGRECETFLPIASERIEALKLLF